MKYTVGYYIKGEPKKYKTFDTHEEAKAFMMALAENPNCEAYGIER